MCTSGMPSRAQPHFLRRQTQASQQFYQLTHPLLVELKTTFAVLWTPIRNEPQTWRPLRRTGSSARQWLGRAALRCAPRAGQASLVRNLRQAAHPRLSSLSALRSLSSLQTTPLGSKLKLHWVLSINFGEMTCLWSSVHQKTPKTPKCSVLLTFPSIRLYHFLHILLC